MFQIKGPILAAAPLGKDAAAVLQEAANLADHYDVELVVGHVLPEICAMRPLFPQFHLGDAFTFAEFEEHVTEKLSELIQSSPHEKVRGARLEIEKGTWHTGLLRLAERVAAGALVIGSHPEQASGGAASSVLHSARCPVLMVRPSPEGVVLAATDFSDLSTPAVAAGAAEALRRGTRLVVLHVIDTLPVLASSPLEYFHPMIPMDFAIELRNHWQEKLDECANSLNATGGGMLRQGAPIPEIVAAAAELSAQLLVVGTHGRSGFSRLAIGSVAEAVIIQASCSVLAVRLN